MCISRLGVNSCVVCDLQFKRRRNKCSLCLYQDSVYDLFFLACAGTLSYVQCDSWGFKYHECPITGADVILNAVVAKKDSVSQCSNQGAGITPANYTENMATLGLYGHMNNVLWVHSGCRANISVCHTGTVFFNM